MFLFVDIGIKGSCKEVGSAVSREVSQKGKTKKKPPL